MGPGTLEAKFIPLSRMDEVDRIFILRKFTGPQIPKVKYIILPKIFRFSIIAVLFSAFILAFYTKKVKADIILSYHFIPYAFYAFIASSITGIPFVVAQTGLRIQSVALNVFYKPWIRLVIKKAMLLFVPGSKSKSFWLKYGIHKSKIKVLHSTIDISHYKPIIGEKKYDFIFLGRLAKEKNIPLLFDSFEKLKKSGILFKTVIVGQGNMEYELKEMVKSKHLEDEILFAGFQDDVVEWLNKSKIFLMASISEGLPTALMQAMACELICVSSNVGNIPDLINEETGFLYDNQDSIELLKTLELLLNKRNNFKFQMRNARKLVVEKHSHESAMEKWKTIFKSLNQL